MVVHCTMPLLCPFNIVMNLNAPTYLQPNLIGSVYNIGVETVIIDEISMVCAATLNFIYTEDYTLYLIQMYLVIW